MKDFDVNYGMIITRDVKENAKEYERKLNKAIRMGKIADIDIDSLPQISMYGMKLNELMQENISINRCHQTAVALSLALPNSKIVFANLVRRADYIFQKDLESEDEDRIREAYLEANAMGSLDPSYNHSFIEVSGKDILASGIKFWTEDNKEFIIFEDKNYVIDAQMGKISDELTYYLINYPHIILSFDNLQKSSIYKCLLEQGDLQKYGINELYSLLRSTYSAESSRLNDYLESIIQQDISILSSRECSSKKVFKGFNDLCALAMI